MTRKRALSSGRLGPRGAESIRIAKRDADRRAERTREQAAMTVQLENSKAEVRAAWERIEPPICDTCANLAIYRHPAGGLRCASCPRPRPL